MGAVFAATHLLTEKRVALKCLHQAVRPDGAPHQRLLREARAAGRINHPNVVNVYDVHEQGHATFDAPPLRMHCPNVDPGFEAVVMKALSRDPANRHQDVTSFVRELEPFAEDDVRFERGKRATSPAPPAQALALDRRVDSEMLTT